MGIMNNRSESINWDHEDPATTAARTVAESTTNTADRAFQVAYMIQVMRSQSVQDGLDNYDGDFGPPVDQAHAEWLNATVAEGDIVVIPGVHPDDPDTVGKVENVGADGSITVARQVALEPGTFQVVRDPNDPNYYELNRPFRVGEIVKATDRGNIGKVLEVGRETVEVEFYNKETGRGRTKHMSVSEIRHRDGSPGPTPPTKPDTTAPPANPPPPPPASSERPPTPGPSSGLRGEPDPEKIAKKASGKPAGSPGQRTNRPANWDPSKGPKRPPNPRV